MHRLDAELGEIADFLVDAVMDALPDLRVRDD